MKCLPIERRDNSTARTTFATASHGFDACEMIVRYCKNSNNLRNLRLVFDVIFRKILAGIAMGMRPPSLQGVLVVRLGIFHIHAAWITSGIFVFQTLFGTRRRPHCAVHSPLASRRIVAGTKAQ